LVVSDYFAELYVAGRFADAGWNVYFPHRDKGFDFIISKLSAAGEELIRPVQVKGKYPQEGKTDKPAYGYIGRLTKIHSEMVLAIPFFSKAVLVPTCVAYMPLSLIRTDRRGYRCIPATFCGGHVAPRRDYARFFDDNGLRLLEESEWSSSFIIDARI
jgi:hypothetical protein